MKPFDFIKTLSQTKEYQTDLTGYVPYLTNQSFSLYPDTIFLANEMNLVPNISERQHYDFYFHSVRPKSRYTKWPKKTEDENLAIVQEFYKYNRRKAKQALALLSDEQLETIKKLSEKGGLE